MPKDATLLCWCSNRLRPTRERSVEIRDAVGNPPNRPKQPIDRESEAMMQLPLLQR